MYVTKGNTKLWNIIIRSRIHSQVQTFQKWFYEYVMNPVGFGRRVAAAYPSVR